MRSGSLPLETLLAPEKVLAELNRLFQMDQHDGNYFTMWFGVYELSSRTLRYATAGAPPAIAVGSGTSPELLATDGQPLGMFDDVGYTSCSFAVPHGCRILLYSDGAFELDLIDGRQWTLPQFTTMFTEMAASSNLSLDELGETLQSLTRSGVFDDDCSLVLLKFD